jgi:fructoselysine-6-P-deglycase FrlB-like protein
MNSAFNDLLKRIMDAISYENQKQTKEVLEQIKGTVAVIGTGGSYPIALFLEKVLIEKNGCFVKAVKPRDLFYDKSNYDNIIAFTYSGKTPSIIKPLEEKKCIKVVFTHDSNRLKENINIRDNYQIIDYSGETLIERSFISIAATLAPICLLAKYFDDTIDIEKVFMSAKKYVDDLNVEFDN